MQRFNSIPAWQRLMAAMLGLFAVLAPQAAFAAPFGFPDQVSVFGGQVNDIYQILTWISIFILVVVEVSLVVALVKFRKKPGENREPATWSHNTKLEVIWTIIPFILLIVVAVPSFKAIAYFADVPKNPDYTLEIVGHQFFWEYRYPDLNVSFNTSPTMGPNTGMEELYVPVNKKIKVVMTSSDVIHAWWVPQFGFQQMTTPGNLVMAPLEVTKTGLYEGACTYLCGSLHGAMRIRVRGVEQPEFDAWVAKMAKNPNIEPIAKVGKVGMSAPAPKKPGEAGAEEQAAAPAAVDATALAAKGKELYASKCAGCHGAEGAGVPGTFPPLAGAEQVNGDDATFINVLLKGLNTPITVKGQNYTGMMPAWNSMTDEEVASVATYVRTSWGNSGKAVTPDLVKAQR